MKKISKLLVLSVLSLSLAFAGMLAACGDTEESSTTATESTSTSDTSSDDVAVTYTVTFDYNYDGATSTSETVEEGSTVSEPETPTRDGYTFDAWYTDEDCTSPYSFDTAVTEDITLYANWLEDGVTYYSVTLHYNNGSSDVVLKVKEGGRAAQPDTPEYEGYVYYGWYTEETFENKFVFSTKIYADTDLYLKWVQATTFEAEDLDFEDLSGPGYSGASYGYDMIVKDTYGAGASNGYYVTYLYASYESTQYNTTLEFHVTSDVAVSGVTLILRLSAEYADIVINGDNYNVLVNGSQLGYDDITFTGAADATNNKTVLAFADYTISAAVTLQAGDNTVTLRTANTTKQTSGGTMNSTAPMVDCIKLAADGATLTWTDGYYVGYYS